jgi:hypothetical protein
MYTLVEVIYDIKSLSGNKALLAAKGRRGQVSAWYIERYGVGPECTEKTHMPVKLDGNKVNRDLPNWKLKVVPFEQGIKNPCINIRCSKCSPTNGKCHSYVWGHDNGDDMPPKCGMFQTRK